MRCRIRRNHYRPKRCFSNELLGLVCTSSSIPQPLTHMLSSLDRTNFVQDILSRVTLESYLRLVRVEWVQVNVLWAHHRELWAENGDALSRIYAGTGALNTSFTRSGKRTLAGVLSDATKSVSRAYINNFQDKGKQVAIDMFLVSPKNLSAKCPFIATVN